MSPVTVPTIDEFAALEARVAVLEGGGGIPPDSGAGIQARRIADLIESFGVGTFSSMDEHNRWGSWPADYRPDSVIAALEYMLGDSGFAFRLREYHYAGYESWQRPWLQQIGAALPGTRATMAVAANGRPTDVDTMVQMQQDASCNIAWLEGINEPNMDFGSGTVSAQTTIDIQRRLHDLAAGGIVMGPSIVAGCPNPAGWIEVYFGDQLPLVNTLLDYGNGHYYPPYCPDVPNTGYSIDEYTGGLFNAYGNHAIHLTEFHPTLYAAADAVDVAVQANIAKLAGRLVGEPPPLLHFRASPSRDAYYALLTLLRCAENGTRGLWWFALFDYGDWMQCGLFPKDHANDPRSAATALQSLCAICYDRGDRHGFVPGKLDITVDGLTPAMGWGVYQASDGRFLVPIWYSAADVGQGVTYGISVGFGSTMDVRVFDPLRGSAVMRESSTSRLELGMAPGVIVLEVR